MPLIITRILSYGTGRTDYLTQKSRDPAKRGPCLLDSFLCPYGPAVVVAVTGTDGGLCCPNASTARTWKLYCVLSDRPPMIAEFTVTFCTLAGTNAPLVPMD